MVVLSGRLVQLWFSISYSVIIGIISCLLIGLRLTVEPFRKRICRNLEKYLFFPVFQYSVFLMDWWSEIRLVLHADGDVKENLFGKENAMCFVNTRNSFLQQLIMAKLGDNYNMVLFNDNNLFQWNNSNHIESNKSSIYRQIQCSNQYWCVLFPDQNPKSQCLCDNFNQLGPSFTNFRNVLSEQEPFDAIYDISIIVTGDWKEITSRDIFDKGSINVHVYLKRIPFNEIPQDESQQKEFLQELCEDKKFATRQFLDCGEFLECQTGINIIEQYEFEPSVRSAVTFTVFSSFTLLILTGVIFLL